ncbi:AAR171Wp [Eremothecium gossypii ATCC 10895]|uniref:AAR171Wp n=1 Tax=Eremothecium gossypii (strain ATCC 10895 / CBS 109.51 / FGSC 9923 / NRRL Y-1056) TaxID=284811 RepID=Q75EA6_EREGS|nr:AAR171Wp [Eremothecium gossypii ATCC 10895]AAS50538.1 AAR171Wp [Eremothecium gossypii ATCC 10895]AEY94825.1 FAAR171Wp [Eremothecium gossypii FDAG1]
MREKAVLAIGDAYEVPWDTVPLAALEARKRASSSQSRKGAGSALKRQYGSQSSSASLTSPQRTKYTRRHSASGSSTEPGVRSPLAPVPPAPQEYTGPTRDWNVLPQCCGGEHARGPGSTGQDVYSELDNFLLFNLETSTKDALLRARERLSAYIRFLELDYGTAGTERLCAACLEATRELVQLWFHQANRLTVRTGTYFIMSEKNMYSFNQNSSRKHDLLVLHFRGLCSLGWQVAFDEPNLRVLECNLKPPKEVLEVSDIKTPKSTVTEGVDEPPARELSPAPIQPVRTRGQEDVESTGHRPSLRDYIERDLEKRGHKSATALLGEQGASPQYEAGNFSSNDEYPDSDDYSMMSFESADGNKDIQQKYKLTSAVHAMTTGIAGLFKKRGPHGEVYSRSGSSSREQRNSVDRDNTPASVRPSSLPQTWDMIPLGGGPRPAAQAYSADLASHSDPQERKNLYIINQWLEECYSKTLYNYDRLEVDLSESRLPYPEASSTEDGKGSAAGSRRQSLAESSTTTIRLPFESNTFPAIFCPGILYMLTFPQWLPFLNEIKRCMVPGAPVTAVLYDFNDSNMDDDGSKVMFPTTLELKKVFQAIRFEAIKRGLQVFPIRNIAPIFRQVGFKNVKYTVLTFKRGDFVNEMGFVNELLATFHYDFLVRTFLTDRSKYPVGTDPQTLPRRYIDEHMGQIDDNAGCLRLIAITAEKPE